ncbi:MAG: FKBP-type peptidyl-prolyl cis-trans isomerase [Deltaproteobacteria bacterium]
MSDKIIEAGDSVRMDSTLKLEGREVGKPYKSGVFVEVKKGAIINGLLQNILGMGEGESKIFMVSPEDGYGYGDTALIKKISLEHFTECKITPEVGMRIRTQHGDCEIFEITDKEVEVDYNHPLCGKILLFNVKILEIAKRDPYQREEKTLEDYFF